MHPKRALTASGLSDREASIYEALLRNGQLTLSGLARATNTNKSTLYLHIDQLLKKGHIKQTMVGKRRRYFAESPRKILRQMQDNVHAFENQLEALLGLFESMQNEPGVAVYRGKEGFVQALEEVTKNSGFLKTFWSPRRYFQLFSQSDDRFPNLTTQAGLVSHTLLEHTDESKRYMKYEHPPFEMFRMLPQEYRDLPVSVLIGSSSVALMSYQDTFVLQINNRAIADFFSTLHDNLWKEANKR